MTVSTSVKGRDPEIYSQDLNLKPVNIVSYAVLNQDRR